MTGAARRLDHRSALAIAAGLLLAPLVANGALDVAQASSVGQEPVAAETTLHPAMTRVDFTLPDLDGRPRQLSEWDGDLVLLNFWATWCPPCKKEMPLFQQRYEQYAKRGFTIVAVAVDELEETRAFVDGFGIEFPVLIGQGNAIAVGREYGNQIGALPYTVVIDREGVVRETHRGEVTESDLDGWLQRYL